MLFTFQTETPETFSYPNFKNASKTIYEDQKQAIRIRTMSLSELVDVRKWLISEGWPGIKYTLAATFSNDQNGFYLLEKDGEKIASISVVTYPEINLAYIGFYVVIKAFRGHGYGKLLINKTMAYAASKLGITTFGLNCIVNAAPMYQKYGFEIENLDQIWKYTAKTNHSSNSKLFDIDEVMFDQIINFDASVFGAHRPEFLRNFIYKPNTTTIISQDYGKLNGYGIISEREPAVLESNKSYKLGPLYADDDQIAKSLLQQLITVAQAGESVYLETSADNSLAMAMVQMGCEKIGTQAKMFKDSGARFNNNKIFCYSSVTIGG